MSKFTWKKHHKSDNIVFNGKEMNTSVEKESVLLTDRVDKDTQSIEELWESMLFFCKNRVEDNKRYEGKYPLSTRQMQMPTLKCLVLAIEDFHNKFENK